MTVATKKPKTKRGRPSLGNEDDFYRYGGHPHRGEYGWAVYHGKEPLDVPVKLEHIENGIPGSTTECIFGLAVSDYFGDRYVVEVACSIVRIIDDKKKKCLVFKLPKALRKRLQLFDRVTFWDLPPAIYRLHPMPKLKKSKKLRVTVHGVTKKIKGTLTVEKPRVKARKPRQPKTRFISRGRIIRRAVEKVSATQKRKK